MIRQEQYDYLRTLPDAPPPGVVVGDELMIDVLLRGLAELIGNSVRLTDAGRTAIASFEAEGDRQN